jgi:peptide/nickel transport system substrate-binding protein
MRHPSSARRAASFLALGAAAALALSACSSAGDSAAPEESSDSVADLALSISGSVPNSLDPDPKEGVAAKSPLVNTVGYLVSYNGVEGETATIDDLRPDMAESIEPSEDGLSWDVKLREGTLSPAGNELTTADVEWTIDRAIANGAGVASTLRNSGIDLEDPITIEDENTFTFNLEQPNSLFLVNISGLGILDSAVYEENATADDPWATTWATTNVAGFGPYAVTSFEPGQQIVYERNDGYWAGPSDVKKVTSVNVPDASTRLTSMLSGDLDMAGISLTDISQFDGSTTAKAYTSTGGTLLYMLFNMKSDKVSEVDTRRAISYAIDREAVNDTAYLGEAEVVTQCTPERWGGVANELDPSPQSDLDAAEDLFSGSETLELGVAATSAGQEEAARVIQANLAEIGITVNINAYASGSTFLADMNAGKLDAWMMLRYPGIQETGWYFGNFFTSDSVYNVMGFSNSEFDELAEEAAITSGDERTTAVTDLCNLFVEEIPAANIMLVPSASAASLTLTNNVQVPDGTTVLYNLQAAE